MKIVHREFMPSRTNSVHAASVEFYNDIPYFAWFGGMREGFPDSSIYIQKLDNQYEFDIGQIAQWNPILVKMQDRLVLFSKVGQFCDRWNTLVNDITDIDNINCLEKFSNYSVLPAGLNASVKTRPIEFEDSWYFGASTETFMNWNSYIERYYVDPVEDFFKNPSSCLVSNFLIPKWTLGEKALSSPRNKGLIQPALWWGEIGPEAFMRSDLGYIYYWSPFENYAIQTQFENPNSGIDVVKHNGFLYLAYNPSKESRVPLHVAKIKQDEEHFEIIETIVIGDKVIKEALTNELSYPYMIEHDGRLHLTYTNGRCKIEYVVIDLED